MALEPIPPRIPDRTERVIRLICGAVAGAVLGILAEFALLQPDGGGAGLALGVALVTPILFAFLALKLGDRFWMGLARWLRWLG